MLLKEENGLQFFQFPDFNRFPQVVHGIFTRNGGFSRDGFKSLNVSVSVGDDENRVRQNRRRIAGCLGENELVFVRQNHGSRVVRLQDNPGPAAGKTAVLMPAGDAIITDIAGKMLVIQVADCQAVMLYDPVRKAVANIHSGWRGSVNNIIGRTLKKMREKFGCCPQDMIAGVGPSLGPCCAEFVNYKSELPETFWPYRDERNCFDFWAVSRRQLREQGVLAENICAGGPCTRCNPHLFYSYRAEGRTGRFAAVIGLKSLT
ncbi:MAG: peptidoglycan editing factor PgeF [Desulfobacterales bacterium]|nr:peptidoglycan editing factor PgeF [Desulfobacterales bacterium]